jgi:hypothetical protein
MPSTKPNIQTVVDQDGAAILDIDRGLILTLNPTGAYVWGELERGHSVAAVIAKLVHETGQERFVVEADVHDFIQALKENHLLAQ